MWTMKINLQGTSSVIEVTLFVKAQDLSLRPGRERKPEGHAHCNQHPHKLLCSCLLGQSSVSLPKSSLSFCLLPEEH